MDEKIKEVATAYAEECFEEELNLLRELAQIPAPSGHEELRAEFIRDWWLAQGAPVGAVRIDDAKNVILSLPAGPHARSDGGVAVFAAHTDVVFPDTEPLPLAESKTRLLAPGVGDDTANLVGLMLGGRYLLRHQVPLDRPLLIVANSCEEGLGNLAGTRELFRHYAGRVAEFTSFDLYLGMHVVSAVSFIEDLYALDLPTEAKTTINVGRFVGGTTVNSIAEDASVLVEYRSASEACLEQMYGNFVVLVEEHLKAGTRIDAKLIGRRPASGEHVPEGQWDLIARTDEVLRELAGVEPTHQESSTDANIPFSLGIPAHTVGTVEGDLLHTREEWVEKDSLRRGLAVILALLLSHARA